MPTWLIVLIVIGVILLALVGLCIGMYNSLIRLRNLVQESWHQIDVELKRRHDLIPNLVETVKGYAAHEQGTLEDVMRARYSAMNAAGPAQAAAAEGALSQSLGRLFAVAESYPDLKANQNFLALQQELTSTEDRIAAGRRYYNANVRELNTATEVFPKNIVANMFGIKRAEYFEADEPSREVPNVEFSPKVGFGDQSAQGHMPQVPAPEKPEGPSVELSQQAEAPATRPIRTDQMQQQPQQPGQPMPPQGPQG